MALSFLNSPSVKACIPPDPLLSPASASASTSYIPPFVWLWRPPGAQQRCRACAQGEAGLGSQARSSLQLLFPPEAALRPERGTFKGARPSWLFPLHPDPVGRCFCHFPISSVGKSSKRLCLTLWLPFQTQQLSLGCSPPHRSPGNLCLPPSPIKNGPFMRVILKAGVCMSGGPGVLGSTRQARSQRLPDFEVSLPCPAVELDSQDWSGRSGRESPWGQKNMSSSP